MKTSLHFAAEAGNYEIFKLLIDHGVNCNAVDNVRNTVLHILVRQKWDERYKNCLTCLLERADLELNFTNNKGQTAAHIAAYEVCKYLHKLCYRNLGESESLNLN